MIRVVLDTNVIVSGLATYRRGETPPARILRAFADLTYFVCSSGPLLAEVIRTLDKPYFRSRIPADLRSAFISALQEEARLGPLTVQVSGVATHPEDDLVLATAVSAAADYLVTGDRQLLKLGAYQGVRIVSPADFLAVLGRSSGAPNAGGDPDDG